MRFAYADPPYLDCCKLYDHFHGDDGLCWDDLNTHRFLIGRLCDEFPDGWAMSLSSTSLWRILPYCPPDVRVSPWCKSFSAFKKGVRPAYAWEPVIWRGGRNPNHGHKHAPPEKGGKQNTPKDFLWEDQEGGLLAPITLKKGFTGAKPESFCTWVLDLLNVQHGDELVDLFPGTGVMGRVALVRTGTTFPYVECPACGHMHDGLRGWGSYCSRECGAYANGGGVVTAVPVVSTQLNTKNGER